jgi:hypothetical protein
MGHVPRPLDIHVSKGKFYLVEHSRQASGAANDLSPGGLLEVSPWDALR